MKVRITKDELYPVFVRHSLGVEVEVPDELWLAYHKALSQFEGLRDRLDEYLYNAKIPNRDIP